MFLNNCMCVYKLWRVWHDDKCHRRKDKGRKLTPFWNICLKIIFHLTWNLHFQGHSIKLCVASFLICIWHKSYLIPASSIEERKGNSKQINQYSIYNVVSCLFLSDFFCSLWVKCEFILNKYSISSSYHCACHGLLPIIIFTLIKLKCYVFFFSYSANYPAELHSDICFLLMFSFALFSLV